MRQLYLLSVGPHPIQSLRVLAARLASTLSDKQVSHSETSRVKTVAWVQSIRRHKVKTFLDVNDGTSPKHLQIVCPTAEIPEGLAVGSAISASGDVSVRELNQSGESSHLAACGSSFSPELSAESLRLLSVQQESGETEEGHPIRGAMSHSRPKLGLLRSDRGLAWRHRLPEMAAMMRLRAAAKSLVHRGMQQRGYLEVDTPILTTTDCEGAGETFLVTPTTSVSDEQISLTGISDDDKRTKAPLHLTVSAQLHLEALAIGFSKVYTLSPTFRAEPSHSRFHLAEFLMLEAESVVMDGTEKLCDEMEAVVHGIVSPYLELLTCGYSKDDLELVRSYLTEDSIAPKSPQGHIDSLVTMLSKPFERMTYHEATEVLRRHHHPRASDDGLNKEEEQALCAAIGGRPVFLTHFPTSQKPFYCASAGADSGDVCAAVDLLVPGVGELVGGSVRETCADALVERMSRQGVAVEPMAWYTGLRTHGGAPHGGFGLGFDRLLLWVLGVSNVRDTVPFPREMGKMYL